MIYLEFRVEAQRWHRHRTAIAIISGIVDVLCAKSEVNATPKMRGVVSFHNVFGPITKCAITQQKAETAIGKINLMIFADAVGDYRHTCAVEPGPGRAPC